MHDVTCSDCGQQTQVPFKPTEGRPVYCKECYQKHKPKRDRY
ncbi:MAG: CxxC-x17-CxxC domain-containing protein [Methanomassiliicoccales archaeon]